MASFFIPLTGLEANSTALNTIANDLSNMNTTAYKAQTTNFSDLFYQQVGTTGAGDPIQVGAGVQVAANELNYSQGSVNSTGNATDVALNGNGFFLISNGAGGYELTRNGNFTQAANGDLLSNGMSVMGYPAANGVVNTNAPLTAINVPVGQVQQPQATSSFGITANLDATSPVGSSFPAPVTLFDSQGVAYQAVVTFTKTGTNTWSYDMSVPDTLPVSNNTAATATTMPVTAGTPASANITGVALTAASPAAPAQTVTLTPATTVNGAAGTTTYTYNFGAGGQVDLSSTLAIGGAGVTPAGPGQETIAALAGQLTTAGATGVTTSGNTVTFTAPTGNVSGNMAGYLSESAENYVFNTGGTVDPASTLTISGTTTAGVAATIAAPTFTNGESISNYAAALQDAVNNAGIANVTVTTSAGPNNSTVLSIVGSDLATSGGLSEDLAGTATAYNFGSTSTVDPTTSLSITGQKADGTTATITAPTVTAGESVTDYATALQNALSGAGIVGVVVNSTGGQLTITGANTSTAGGMAQNETATSASYTFGSSGGNSATVDTSTNLTISGLTSTGATATMVAPAMTAGETVATYATALQNAINAAGIAGVSVANNNGVLTVTGANQNSTGNVIQDAVASANASGTFTFDANGNLVSPAADVGNLTFGGLSDGAANLGLTWNILGTTGSPTIGQVDTASAVSGTTPNGYAAGQYNGFTIGSNGTVTAQFSNGQNENVGQLALANVANLQGLSLQGDGDYVTTRASGAAVIGTSGSAGLGTVQDDSLEASNVNISTEFSDLIIAQRAFEANAKSVTTFDTVTQDTINMVH